MKTLLMFTLLLSSMWSFLHETADAGPRAVLAESFHDIGTVPEGTIISHAFTLFNHGDAPLEILGVSPG